jgi:hypothetical protein
MNNIEYRRIALNDAPRLDAVQITGVYEKITRSAVPTGG